MMLKKVIYYIKIPFIFIARVLCDKEIPVWLTVLFAITGALATYWLAPWVNEKFELQRARREFIVGNLNSLSAETTALVSVSADLDDASNRVEWAKKRDEVLSIVRKAQFEAVKLVLISAEGSNVVLEYQRSLDDFRQFVETANYIQKEGKEDIRVRARLVAENAIKVNIFLLKAIGLR